LERLLLALALILSVLVVGVLWSVPYVATHDGPNHIASCVLEKRAQDPANPVSRWIQPGSPITYHGYHSICAALEGVAGWRWAHRLTLTLIALFFALAYDYCARGLDRTHPLRLLGFGFALPWAMYMGFFDYLLASAMLFFVAGFLIRREHLRAIEWIEIGAAILAVALVHVFVAAALGPLVVLLTVMREAPAERVKALGKSILAGAPAMLLALSARGGTDAGDSSVWPEGIDRLRQLGATALGGSESRTWVPIAFAFAALTLGGHELWKRRAISARAIVGLYGALLMIAYFAAPLHMDRWAFFSPRFAFLALAVSPLALPSRWFEKGPGFGLILGAVLAFDVSSLLWAGSYQQKFEPLVEEAMSGLAAPIHRDGPRLPLFVVEGPRDLPDAEPLIMMGHLYMLDQGGVDPYFFGEQRLTDGIMYKAHPLDLFGEVPKRFMFKGFECAGQKPGCPTLDVQYEWFTIWGRRFEDVIVFADDPAIAETFRRRGYAEDFSHGRLAIFHPRACKAALRVFTGGGEAATPSALRFRAGRAKIASPMHETKIPQAVAVPADGLALGFEGPDCGDLWLSLTVEGTGASACTEADARSEIPLAVMPDAPAEARCTLRLANP
jgi:hypothetical protein